MDKPRRPRLYMKAIRYIAGELHPTVPPKVSLAARLVAFVWDIPLDELEKDLEKVRKKRRNTKK